MLSVMQLVTALLLGAVLFMVIGGSNSLFATPIEMFKGYVGLGDATITYLGVGHDEAGNVEARFIISGGLESINDAQLKYRTAERVGEKPSGSLKEIPGVCWEEYDGSSCNTPLKADLQESAYESNRGEGTILLNFGNGPNALPLNTPIELVFEIHPSGSRETLNFGVYTHDFVRYQQTNSPNCPGGRCDVVQCKVEALQELLGKDRVSKGDNSACTSVNSALYQLYLAEGRTQADPEIWKLGYPDDNTGVFTYTVANEPGKQSTAYFRYDFFGDWKWSADGATFHDIDTSIPGVPFAEKIEQMRDYIDENRPNYFYKLPELGILENSLMEDTGCNYPQDLPIGDSEYVFANCNIEEIDRLISSAADWSFAYTMCTQTLNQNPQYVTLNNYKEHPLGDEVNVQSSQTKPLEALSREAIERIAVCDERFESMLREQNWISKETQTLPNGKHVEQILYQKREKDYLAEIDQFIQAAQAEGNEMILQ